jgi:predicted AAA+ superfamily ATPase
MTERYLELIEEVRNQYRPRIIDPLIKKKLSAFGGVEITGPKSCGKSWTGINHSNSFMFLGEEEANRYAELNPQSALDGEYPHLVDEWQDVSKLWDIARRNIDFKNKKGMYIFTGSTVTPYKKTSHTGTDRIARLQMRTMSLFESGESNGTVSMSGLFDTGRTEVVSSDLNYRKVVDLICRGGWPGAIGVDDEAAIERPYDYIRSLKELDTSRVDGKRRSSTRMGYVLRSLARNNATSASISTITADIKGAGDNISEQTVRSYVDVLKKLFVIEEQDAWHPDLRSKSRIRKAGVRHFTDPSLAAAVMGAGPGILLKDVKTTGFLFETLCYRDVSVYASVLKGRVFHYRDGADLEVDEIIQLEDGRWGAAEVKLGTFEFEKAASNLIRLKNKMVEAGAEEPSFLMILNATGGAAHTRPDGIVEVPIDCLGP